MKFISCLEEQMGMQAIKEFHPLQAGDVEETAADNSAIKEWINFEPNTSLENGIKRFTSWFKNYYLQK
jgi:UDP-glucuronate 4-epimerase